MTTTPTANIVATIAAGRRAWWRPVICYAVTPTDRLWLLRAVQYEGNVHAQVAQVLVNGFALNLVRGVDRTLVEHCREYAQPINPRWLPDGDLFLSHNAANAKKWPLSDALDRVHHCSRMAFSPYVIDAVNLALTKGVTCIPKSCTDYARSDLDSERLYGPPLTDRAEDARLGRNTLWTRKRDWPGYTVVAS